MNLAHCIFKLEACDVDHSTLAVHRGMAKGNLNYDRKARSSRSCMVGCLNHSSSD